MALPLISRKILTFQQIGVDSKFANISNATLSLDKYLCICENSDTDSHVLIVDLRNKNKVIKHKINADTAVMHPSRKIIAFRSGSMIQIFDLNKNQCLKCCQLLEGQVVNYWKWINDQTLVLVSGGYICNWSITGQSNPIPIFILHPQLASGIVMSYSISHNQQWYAISCLVKEGENTVGKVQLFSSVSNGYQIFDGYSASFTNIKSLPLLVFASKTNDSMILNIFALGTSRQAVFFGKKHVEISMASDLKNDFPQHLVISQHYSTAFLFTKLGYLHCVEIETPFLYISKRVSQIPFIHASLARDGNVIILFGDGKMSKFVLDNATIIDYIVTRRGNQQAAAKVAAASGLQISNVLINQKFNQLIQMGNYVEAAKIAINSPGDVLRNQQTIEKLRRIPNNTKGPSPLLQYFMIILEKTKLNEIESIELCKIILAQNKTNFIEKWIKEDKLTATEHLGDLCKRYPKIALALYIRANVSSKIIISFVELGMFDKIQAYCQQFSYKPNWIQIVTCVASQSPDKIEPFLKYIANDGKPLVDPKVLVQVLLQYKLVKAAKTFIIDAIPQDRGESSELQKLLFDIELIINSNSQAASATTTTETKVAVNAGLKHTTRSSASMLASQEPEQMIQQQKAYYEDKIQALERQLRDYEYLKSVNGVIKKILH